MNLRPLAVLALVVVTALTVTTLGVTGAPLVGAEDARRVEQGEPNVPIAGGGVCITGAHEEGREVDLVLLTAPETPETSETPELAPDASTADVPDPEVAARAQEARSVVLTFGESATRRAIGPVGPGDLSLVEAAPGEAGWVWSGWAGLPVVTWHESRVTGSTSEPGGAIASTCLAADSTEHTLLGLRTDESHEALIRVVNPFRLDATFAVTLVTPFDETRPVVLRNVSVPAGEVVTVRLNDHIPEERDVAAVITVGSGRLAVEGLQRSVAALGGVDGLSVAPAVTAPSSTWAFPWLPVGPDIEAAVWLLNPSSSTVEVEIAVHTPQGATTTPLDEVVRVAPRGLVRLDAADLSPDGSGAFGVTLRADAEVAAAAGASFLPLDGGPSGLVRFAASPGPDVEWVVAGRGAPGRQEVLHILNLSDVEVTPRVSFTSLSPAAEPVPGGDDGEGGDGSEGGEGDDGSEGDDGEGGDAGDAGPDARAPTTLGAAAVQDLDVRPVAPGAVGEVLLPTGGVRAWSAVVAGQGLVVSRTASGDERLDPVATAAVASSGWRTSDRALVGRPLDGWVARVGTAQEREREVRLPVR